MHTSLRPRSIRRADARAREKARKNLFSVAKKGEMRFQPETTRVLVKDREIREIVHPDGAVSWEEVSPPAYQEIVVGGARCARSSPEGDRPPIPMLPPCTCSDEKECVCGRWARIAAGLSVYALEPVPGHDGVTRYEHGLYDGMPRVHPHALTDFSAGLCARGGDGRFAEVSDADRMRMVGFIRQNPPLPTMGERREAILNQKREAREVAKEAELRASAIGYDFAVFFRDLRAHLREEKRNAIVSIPLAKFFAALGKHLRAERAGVSPAFAKFFTMLGKHAAVGRSLAWFFRGASPPRVKKIRAHRIAPNFGKALAEVGAYLGRIRRIEKHAADARRKADVAALVAAYQKPRRVSIPRTEVACF